MHIIETALDNTCGPSSTPGWLAPAPPALGHWVGVMIMNYCGYSLHSQSLLTIVQIAFGENG